MFAKSVIKIEKRVGHKTQPCFNPNSWSNQSDSKSPNITYNYRGITLTSNVNKVFSKILETLILDFLESNNILGETQGAFRKDRRIEDQIFSLQETLGRTSRIQNHQILPYFQPFHTFSIVVSSISLLYLFPQQCKKAISPDSIKGRWRLLWKMYEKVENKVIFGDFESDWFDQEFGLKQGCVLSSTLFSKQCKKAISPDSIKGL
jgi:hypothetical protein